MIQSLEYFYPKMLSWYEKNKRELPWRNIKDPYKVWVSEIILQQTRVNQGLPYYENFIKKFPTLESLATSDEKDVLKIWQGLGYYSRARNIFFTAKVIYKDLKNIFPDNYANLIQLKGIGKYIAAAIASFCFNEKVPVLDGNVKRVISRIYEIDENVNSSVGEKILFEKAKELISFCNTPDMFNQAMMELGALTCLPRNPDCKNCPVSGLCNSFNKNTQNKFPVVAKKIKIKTRFLNYLVIKYNNQILIKKRDENDIWKGLYDFFHIESPIEIQKKNKNEFLTKSLEKYKINYKLIYVSENHVHILSHQKLNIKFWILSMENKKINKNFKTQNVFWVDRNTIDRYPVPKVIEKFLIDLNKY